MERSAEISSDGVYRYSLTRAWEPRSLDRRCLFIMLNPSTADAEKDDPTIRRCVGFARREHCSELHVVNLFAYRATKPKDLRAAAKSGQDIFGPCNATHICDAIRYSSLIICAWGNNVIGTKQRLISHLLRKEDRKAVCLGLTGQGEPTHPLMTRADLPLVPWVGPFDERRIE